MTDQVWVAFLRGMNLGGRRLTNDELRAAVTACGCDDVETYQASGNVVLRDARPHDELTGGTTTRTHGTIERLAARFL